TPSARRWPRTAAASSPAASAWGGGGSAGGPPTAHAPPAPPHANRVAGARLGGRWGAARAGGRPPVAGSVPRLGAAGRPAPDAAPLCVSEDLRGMQQSLLVLHHPAAARRPRQPAGCARDG